MSPLETAVHNAMQSLLYATRILETSTNISETECIVVMTYVVRTPVSWKFGSGSLLEVVITINSHSRTIEHSWRTKVCGWDRCYVRISELHHNDSEESLLSDFVDYLDKLSGASNRNLSSCTLKPTISAQTNRSCSSDLISTDTSFGSDDAMDKSFRLDDSISSTSFLAGSSLQISNPLGWREEGLCHS